MYHTSNLTLTLSQIPESIFFCRISILAAAKGVSNIFRRKSVIIARK